MTDPPPTPGMLAAARAAICLIGIAVFAASFALLQAVLPESWALGIAVVSALGALRNV